MDLNFIALAVINIAFAAINTRNFLVYRQQNMPINSAIVVVNWLLPIIGPIATALYLERLKANSKPMSKPRSKPSARNAEPKESERNGKDDSKYSSKHDSGAYVDWGNSSDGASGGD